MTHNTTNHSLQSEQVFTKTVGTLYIGVVILVMATPAELRAAFEARIKEGIPNPPGEFHPLDYERVNDDRYLIRVLSHVDNDLKPALDMLWNLMIWRKEFGANEINENTIRMDYVKEGLFFARGRDVDGCLLLIVELKKHVKGKKDFEELKRIIIYWLDRIEREENGKKVTLFFDMDGCGLENIDMELIQYFKIVFESYYPYLLNYIVIYQLPWMFSAFLKVVKSMLPVKGMKILKYCNKDNLKTTVAPEQALTCWGGKDPYVFEFIPENCSGVHDPKKIALAENSGNHSPGEMLRLNPDNTIIFKNDNDVLSGEFTITNMDENVVSFKIRTTVPEKFRVHPCTGTLPSGSSQTVHIIVHADFQAFTVTKDRFLVMSVQIPQIDLTPKQLAEVWHSAGSKIVEYLLVCQYPDNMIRKENETVLYGKSAIKWDSVTNAINNLQSDYKYLHRNVRKLKLIQFLTLSLTGVNLMLVYLLYLNMRTLNEGYCERMLPQ